MLSSILSVLFRIVLPLFNLFCIMSLDMGVLSKLGVYREQIMLSALDAGLIISLLVLCNVCAVLIAWKGRNMSRRTLALYLAEVVLIVVLASVMFRPIWDVIANMG